MANNSSQEQRQPIEVPPGFDAGMPGFAYEATLAGGLAALGALAVIAAIRLTGRIMNG